MKVIFAGTPDFAASHLQALIESSFDIVGVYTQPDRPAGRGKKPKASSVKVLALEQGLKVFQPENFKSSDATNELANLHADIMVVVAYGIILPKQVLDTPKLGCVNVHGSLLPLWRGAAPIQRSIWAGDKETGVTIMLMDEGLDTGPMLYKSALPIEESDTSASLYTKLAKLGPKALVEALSKFDTLTPEQQNSENVSYANKLSKEEAEIDWSLSAEQLERNCRAFNPWPVQWFSLNDIAIKVWTCDVVTEASLNAQDSTPGTIVSADKHGIVVSTSDQCLRLTNLQFPGKKPMGIADIMNSRADWFEVGAQL